jgi:hypothetical protein
MDNTLRPKMKLWKKITIISVASFIALVILVNVFMDKYKMGIDAYNKKDYEKAFRYLKQIKPDDKNYADASVKATASKNILDSLGIVAANEEKLKDGKANADANAKIVAEPQEQSTPENNVAEGSSKTIPGLEPVDVYLNLEKQGFSIDKKFSAEYGCSWFCKSTLDGIDYDVTIYGSTASVVEEIKAQATINTADNIQASKDFFNYIASIPYDNADHDQVSNWLKNNFNKDKQSITISGVTFTIYCPTKFGRLLTIETKK